LWAVGRRDIPGGRQMSQPAAMRWNGHAWRLVTAPVFHFREPVPEPTAELVDVVALAADDAWAFGVQTFDHGEMGSEPPDPPAILLHWNGTRGTRQLPNPRLGHCCRLLAPDGKGRDHAGQPIGVDAYRGRAVHQAARTPGVHRAGRKDELRLRERRERARDGPAVGVGSIAHLEAGNYRDRVAIVRYR
jgi:hypothetical protein